MSNLVVGNLLGYTSADNFITMSPGHTLKYPGALIQTVYARTDARSSYASPASGNGTTITDLNISITPKFSDSLLLITWMMNGEIGENNVFVIHQDGALITTTGYEGYNNVAGNSRWSGFVAARYDADVATTPQNYTVQYYVPAGSTASRIYAPAVRAANATAQTFFLNRCAGSTGADGNEVQISTACVMEIAQ